MDKLFGFLKFQNHQIQSKYIMCTLIFFLSQMYISVCVTFFFRNRNKLEFRNCLEIYFKFA
jgi:hypothetical protein